MWERHTARQKREDYRAAVVATILANSNRDRKKKSNPYRVGDFFPSLKEPDS